jgi:hypothetical protein
MLVLEQQMLALEQQLLALEGRDDHPVHHHNLSHIHHLSSCQESLNPTGLQQIGELEEA